ncbi:MAG: hypothetical protein NC187_08140 [Candidatus Amulumruptor caecigallinarius]|nr:hypothetical protein [Candidatus Amulumruptor caecigallinarius]MCM1397438.1 hypothetical protein [Candidatus Amulumruptor caecigallinarius]MCM1454354.1 hypothetical protein [bacterium]
MAITLNKQALRCEEIAVARGKITPQSSPRTSLYDISRQWRELLGASGFPSEGMPGWSEKEAAAAELLIATLTYLQHIGCKNIEQLLRDAIERQARQNE